MNEIASRVMQALLLRGPASVADLFASLNIRGRQHNICYFNAVIALMQQQGRVNVNGNMVEAR